MTTPLMCILAILPCVAGIYNVEETIETDFQFNLSYDDINISASCSKALHKLFNLESTNSPLMLHYWDSWGKPSHGILEGHTSYLGYYDECINLKDTDFGKTDYCIYAMQMNVSTLLKPIPIQVGVCFPSSCSSQEFARILSEMDITSVVTVLGNSFSVENYTVSVNINSNDKLASFCPQTDEDYDASTILIIIGCGVVVVMAIVGTTVDIVLWLLSTDLLKSQEAFSKYNGSIQADDIEKHPANEKHPLIPKSDQKSDRPIVKDFILAFSLYNTVPVLVSMKQSPSAIKALSGIRFHAIISIIMGHLTIFYSTYHYLVENPKYARDLLTRFLLQPVANLSLAVDAFFLMGAFLSSYLTFKDIEKHGRFRYLYFYLHRYFRISPLLYFYTLVSIKLVYHIDQGPLWSFPVAAPCKDNWWYNLLYIGNVNDDTDICISYTWYLFVDMQLFIFSPIIILLLYHYWYVGLMVITLAVIGATTAIGVQAGVNDDFYANMALHPQLITKQLKDLYLKPHYRVNTYLIGILLGHIFYKKYWITSLSINKWLKLLIYIVLWVVAIVLCTTTMFGTYKGDEFGKFQNVTYLMFNGLAWSIGLSIIIYICNTGYGGVVNSYLSWSVWEPLAKMTFGVYLCHMLITSIMFSTFQSTLILTDYIYAMMCVFVVVASFAWSSVTFVFLELPISKVVSLCFKLFGMEDRRK